MLRPTIAISFLATLATSNAWSQSAGTVDFWNGTVAISSKAGEKQIPYNGLGINAGDVIQTGADGELYLVLGDGGMLAVRPNSVVRLAAFSAKGDDGDETWVDLLEGALRSVTGWIGKTRPASHKVTTPIGIIGVRGTDFDIVHDAAGTHNWVHEGMTILRTPKGEVEVRSGEAASVQHAAETPRLHDGVPQFMRERVGKFERRIAQHAERINENIGQALRERGLLRQDEPVERYIERRRHDGDKARPEARERRGGEAKPERTERASDRPERTERASDRPDKPERSKPDRGDRNHRN
jgi:FecR protein